VQKFGRARGVWYKWCALCVSTNK